MNTIKKVALFCASMVLCFGFCGCSNDDDDGNPTSKEKKLVKITNKDQYGTKTMMFGYDKQGYLVSVIRNEGPSSSYTSSYEWSDDHTRVNDGYQEFRFDHGLAMSGKWLNENIKMAFIYDNKSRLVSYDCGYDYKGNISWDKNCISEVHYFGKIVYSGKTCKGYNPYIVSYACDSPFYELSIAQPRLFGLYDNHLPNEVKWQGENGSYDNIDISYELDKDGYLIKLTATHQSSESWENGETETYEYTWE